LLKSENKNIGWLRKSNSWKRKNVIKGWDCHDMQCKNKYEVCHMPLEHSTTEYTSIAQMIHYIKFRM